MLNLKDYKCVIFDLDGTLLDSTNVWSKIDIAFLGKRGIPVTEDFIREIKAHTFETGSVYVVNKYNLSETPEEVAKEWFDMAIDAYSNEIKLKPFVKELLVKIKDLGIVITTATSSDKTLFEPCLKRNGVYDFFDSFTQTNEVERSKRYPDVYLKAAKKCGFKADECIVFEDVLSAVESAKNGGFTVVGVYDEASRSDWEEIKLKADYYVESYENII